MEKKGYWADLGLVDYGKAWDLQRRLWERRAAGAIPDTVLLLEHPPVLTLGRRGNRTHLLVPEETLAAMKVPLFHIERGGDVTFHGPGQLVGYPIFDLKENGYHLVRYVDQLEELILRVLADFGIEGRREPGNRGVWAGPDKIASIGITVKRWVAFHGFALNYATELNYFDLINPCGLVGTKVTSMERVLGKPVPREALAGRIVERVKEIFPRNWQEKKPEEIGVME
jgi:lipoate-protein ligase B